MGFLPTGLFPLKDIPQEWAEILPGDCRSQTAQEGYLLHQLLLWILRVPEAGLETCWQHR